MEGEQQEQAGMAGLEQLARLLRQRNEIDRQIAQLLQRPVAAGHVGETIASVVFGITLHKSAVHKTSDGLFASGPLQGASVEVKCYSGFGGYLDIHTGDQPDYYLVLAGSRCSAASSRGTHQPKVIRSVYLFETQALLGDLQGRGVKIGDATSVRKALWEAAEVYPHSVCPLLCLTEAQRQLLALFAE